MAKRIGLVVATAMVFAAALWAQQRVYIFNGVEYAFPTGQGAAGEVLTNDGAGNLDWSNVPTAEGLWSGAVVLSNTSCPTGWTRLAAADGRILRAAASGGGTGGSDTHTHTMTGTTASQTVTITGNTGSSGVAITGSTGSTSISHTHGVSANTTTVASGGTTVVTGVTINAGDANHSHSAGTLSGGGHAHGVGTLAGAAHTHGSGSLAAGSASNVPAYYGVVVCVKD